MGFERYHVVGHSMGGMIAQIIAATDRDRVLSLTSLCSSAGQAMFRPHPSALAGMQAYLSSYADIDTAVAARVAGLAQAMDHAPPEALYALGEFTRIELERCNCPGGNLRQFWAVAASGERAKLLGKITCPTLAILGGQDKAIPPEIGACLVDLVPNCELHVFKSMGHAITDNEVPFILSKMQASANK